MCNRGRFREDFVCWLPSSIEKDLHTPDLEKGNFGFRWRFDMVGLDEILKGKDRG